MSPSRLICLALSVLLMTTAAGLVAGFHPPLPSHHLRSLGRPARAARRGLANPTLVHELDGVAGRQRQDRGP